MARRRRKIDDIEVRSHELRLTGQLETVKARHLDIGDEEIDPTAGQDAYGFIAI
jgi:hypothetical protein